MAQTKQMLGDFEVASLDAGRLRLDGGAMFRVVPKAMWDRLAPADEQNRIGMSMRPLLIRTGQANLIVDSGIGAELRDDKFNERFGAEDGAGLEASLAELGLSCDDIDYVILSHMHFDHTGGCSSPEGTRFKNAKLVVQAAEFEDAGANCPLCKASYVEADWQAFDAAGRVMKVDGDCEIVPGVRVQVTGGHTRAHQIVHVESGADHGVFWGDLVPTTAHIPPHFVMAYDLYPMDSWKAKCELLESAASEGWTNFFYHDTELSQARIVKDGRRLRHEALHA